MEYCEAWLGTRKVKTEKGEQREFRVEVAAPSQNKVPPGYKPKNNKLNKEGKNTYYSEWFSAIDLARDELFKVAKFYESMSCKVVVYFEIRGKC